MFLVKSLDSFNKKAAIVLFNYPYYYKIKIVLLTKESFFKEYLYKELELASSSLSFPVKNYLVELFCLYLYSDQFFEKQEGQTKSHESTLADLYKKSQISKPQEKLYLFKKIGDLSLYISGFFRLAIKRKIVHISYYEQMGQTAYHLVSSAYGSKPNVFKELAEEFKNLSQILFSIHKKSETKNSRYLLKFTEQSLSKKFTKLQMILFEI